MPERTSPPVLDQNAKSPRFMYPSVNTTPTHSATTTATSRLFRLVCNETPSVIRSLQVICSHARAPGVNEQRPAGGTAHLAEN